MKIQFVMEELDTHTQFDDGEKGEFIAYQKKAFSQRTINEWILLIVYMLIASCVFFLSIFPFIV